MPLTNRKLAAGAARWQRALYATGPRRREPCACREPMRKGRKSDLHAGGMLRRPYFIPASAPGMIFFCTPGNNPNRRGHSKARVPAI